MAVYSGISSHLLALCILLFHGSMCSTGLQKRSAQIDQSVRLVDEDGYTTILMNPLDFPNEFLRKPLYTETLKFANQNEPPRRICRSRRGKLDAVPGMSCPMKCSCKYRQNTVVDIVSCSNARLKEIPPLPSTSREVYLQGNEITEIPCIAFRKLRMLKKLDLSQNKDIKVSGCSFARLSSLEYLRLSGSRLRALPVEVFGSMHQLIQLDLSENNIATLVPHVFSDLNKLERLDLGKNILKKLLNDTFHGLSSLLFLSLEGNMLRYLPETFELGAFQGLSSLRQLNLNGNQPTLVENLTYPDQSLSQVTTLETIWLDGYPRVLGPGFSSLRKLSSLIFRPSPVWRFCSFGSGLPRDFFSNLATEEPLNLDMADCSIKTIHPDLFKFVPTIHSLKLTYNHDLGIDGFEKGSKGLENSNLTALDISEIVTGRYHVESSKIKSTTFQYLKTTSLKVLIVEHLQLTDIDPRAMFDLPQTLEYISFYKNYLVHWTGVISGLRFLNLKVFKLSFDLHLEPAINSTPGFYWNSYSFRKGQNNSRYLKSGIGYTAESNTVPSLLTFLKELQPTINEASVMKTRNLGKADFCDETRKSTSAIDPLIFPNVPLPHKLERIIFNNFKIKNIPIFKMFNNKVLKYLDLSSNDIECFGGPGYGLPSVEYLDLSNNWSSQLNPLLFSNVTTLKTVRLSKNRLGPSLSADIKCLTFSTLTLLETLDLSKNAIEHLQEFAFKTNENLRILDLSHNAFVNSLPSLAYNRKLEVLDLSSNQLVGLPESTCSELLEIKKSSVNFSVNIGENNDFQCNCDNLYFPNFLLKHPGIFEDLTTFSCQLANGTRVSYGRLEEVLPQLGLQCLTQPLFVAVLIAFFLLVGILSICGLYRFKRWQWKYLYYVGRSRFHIGSICPNYRPAANAFVTYDQVSIAWKPVVITSP